MGGDFAPVDEGSVRGSQIGEHPYALLVEAQLGVRARGVDVVDGDVIFRFASDEQARGC